MEDWQTEYEAERRARQDPRNLLAGSERWADNAIGCAEDPSTQAAAAIFAQVATAKAIAALAAAILTGFGPDRTPVAPR
jgi:hypothetical protein